MHTDLAGNVIALTDSLENVARTYAYGLWGASIGGADSAGFAGVDRPRFKGALWMGPQLDLYYMRNRWYETKSGRFLSEDPIGLPGGRNAYVFAADDPINLRDASGLCPTHVRRDDGTFQDSEDARVDEVLSGDDGRLYICGSDGIWRLWVPPGAETGGSAGGEEEDSKCRLSEQIWGGGCGEPVPMKTPKVILCVASSLAFGANVVTSALTFWGAAEVAAGVYGAEVTAFTGSVLGFSATTDAAFATSVALITRGGSHMLAGALPGTITAVGVAGDAATGNLSLKSLVPFVGLGDAASAVASNCPVLW